MKNYTNTNLKCIFNIKNKFSNSKNYEERRRQDKQTFTHIFCWNIYVYFLYSNENRDSYFRIFIYVYFVAIFVDMKTDEWAVVHVSHLT